MIYILIPEALPVDEMRLENFDEQLLSQHKKGLLSWKRVCLARRVGKVLDKITDVCFSEIVVKKHWH